MKTASDLNLTQREFDALIAVRDMLAKYDSKPTKMLFADDETFETLNADNNIYVHRALVNALDGFGGFKMDCAVVPYYDNTRYAEHYECGTVACIGGWLSLHLDGAIPKEGEKLKIDRSMRNNADAFVDAFSSGNYRGGTCSRHDEYVPSPISLLFYPRRDDGSTLFSSWDMISSAHAVQAINNVLNDGAPHWQDVLIEIEQPYIDAEKEAEARRQRNQEELEARNAAGAEIAGA